MIQMEQKKNNMALTSMILGIVSIVTACCCFIGFPVGGLAIMFSCLSKVDSQMEKRAMTGMITGIVGIVLSVISLVILVVILGNSSGSTSFYNEFYSFAPAMHGLLKGGAL